MSDIVELVFLWMIEWCVLVILFVYEGYVIRRVVRSRIESCEKVLIVDFVCFRGWCMGLFLGCSESMVWIVVK